MLLDYGRFGWLAAPGRAVVPGPSNNWPWRRWRAPAVVPDRDCRGADDDADRAAGERVPAGVVDQDPDDLRDLAGIGLGVRGRRDRRRPEA